MSLFGYEGTVTQERAFDLCILDELAEEEENEDD